VSGKWTAADRVLSRSTSIRPARPLPRRNHVKPLPFRALSAGVLALALVASAAIPADAADLEPTRAHISDISNTAKTTNTVTLITGDVVTLRQGASAGNSVTVTAADGSRADVRVIESGDDLFVYPKAALPYVAAGTLDKQLFNVTELVADGYDDSNRQALPLIVLYKDAASSRRDAAVPTGAKRIRTLSSVHGSAVAQDRKQAAGFWSAVTTAPGTGRAAGGASFNAGIAQIWLDGQVTPSLEESTAQIGAPEVWGAGNTGRAFPSPFSTPGSTPLIRTLPGGSPPVPVSFLARRSPTGTGMAPTSPPPLPAPVPPRGAPSEASRPAPPSPSARCSGTTDRGSSPGSLPAWSGPRASSTPRSSA
jgi:hypothetical protein